MPLIRNPNPSRLLVDFNSIKEYEGFLKTWVQSGIFNYNALRVVERFSDDDGIITEELMLVEDKNRKIQFMLHIIELKDMQTLTLTLREANVLRQLDGHENVMTLFSIFRHRQYIGLLLPAYSPLQDRIEYANENKDLSGTHGSALRFGPLRKSRQQQGNPGLFTPNAVAYVLQYVVRALDFLHSKQFVHTQICALNVFMDGGGQVKLGGFLHTRRIGSSNWTFTGDPNCYPPEAFDIDPDLSFQHSFDYWSLGLFALELITGKKESHSDEKCRRNSVKYRNGTKDPPTLADFSSTTLINPQQNYDENVGSFLAHLLTVNPQDRLKFSPNQHPFLKREIDEIEARREWNIPVTSGLPFDGDRSLFQEMFNSQGSRTDFAQDFLLRILRAVKLVERDFFPIFNEIPDAKLFEHYVGIEASVAIALDDSEWSRDVLNVSRASSGRYTDLVEQNAATNHTPDRPTRNPLSGEDFEVPSHHPGLEKDYQRHEMIFFVKKSWSDEDRHIFIALQFSRWFHRGIIKFPDLVRICDELEDIIQDYVMSKSRAGPNPPDSIYFASALRRLLLNPAEHQDRETRHLCHLYVDVALTSEMNAEKKKKMLKLAEGDPVDKRSGLTTLQAAVCYKEVDVQKFDAIERQLLGQIKVSGWAVDEAQRKKDMAGPETRLYRLLYERRRNPNKQAASSSDWSSSAQARTAKLWGDYDRDFLYKACDWAIPHKLDEERAKKLYGNPFEAPQVETGTDEDSILQMQLSRTRVKQEEDVILPIKSAEDVEARRAALADAEATLARLKNGRNGDQEGVRRLGDQLKQAETSLNTSGIM